MGKYPKAERSSWIEMLESYLTIFDSSRANFIINISVVPNTGEPKLLPNGTIAKEVW